MYFSLLWHLFFFSNYKTLLALILVFQALGISCNVGFHRSRCRMLFQNSQNDRIYSEISILAG